MKKNGPKGQSEASRQVDVSVWCSSAIIPTHERIFCIKYDDCTFTHVSLKKVLCLENSVRHITKAVMLFASNICVFLVFWDH